MDSSKNITICSKWTLLSLCCLKLDFLIIMDSKYDQK